MNSYQVFHSSRPELGSKLHVVLVRPEYGGNVGSAARALANMGIKGKFKIVGTPDILTSECRKFAKHACDRLDAIRFYPSLEEALADGSETPSLKLAATARIGSPGRPHPLMLRVGAQRAIEKLKLREIREIQMVFGPESDGLTNEEVDQCDWIVTIPSAEEYRSLNLAQAILLFSYECRLNLLETSEPFESAKPSQKDRLIRHLITVAEDSGFIAPGDPFKMRPRLEEIFSALPKHLPAASTLHGLLDQVSRSVKKGAMDVKGRYKQAFEES